MPSNTRFGDTVTEYSTDQEKLYHLGNLNATTLNYFSEVSRIKPSMLIGEKIVGDEIEDGFSYGITPGLFIFNQKVTDAARNKPEFLLNRYKLLIKTFRKMGVQGKIAIPFKYFRITSMNTPAAGTKMAMMQDQLGVIGPEHNFGPANASHIYVDEIYFEYSASAMIVKTMIENIIREHATDDYLPMFNWIIQKIADYDKETG